MLFKLLWISDAFVSKVASNFKPNEADSFFGSLEFDWLIHKPELLHLLHGGKWRVSFKQGTYLSTPLPLQ